MSVALFNSIIYYVTDNMRGNINLQGNSTISHMEFADGLILFAQDDVMMQNQVDYVVFRLTQCGLNFKGRRNLRFYFVGKLFL